MSANTQYISFAAGSKFSIWAAAQSGRVGLICDANVEEIGILCFREAKGCCRRKELRRRRGAAVRIRKSMCEEVER